MEETAKISWLINKAEVKRRAIKRADRKIPGKFTRVSGSFLNDINAEVANLIDRKISAMPTLGHTIK